MEHNPLLVPVDFTVDCLEALRFAADHARGLNAPLHLVMVIRPAVLVYNEFGLPLTYMPSPTKEDGEAYLHRLAAGYPDLHITTSVVYGRPSEAILEMAAEIRATAIVVGHHDRNNLVRLLTGSTTEEVSRRCCCPVVSVRAPHRSATREPAPASTSAARSGAETHA